MRPQLGQTVHYHPAGEFGDKGGGDQGLAAIVAHVNDDGTYNLCVFDDDGVSCSRRNVVFADRNQDGLLPEPCCTWLPDVRAVGWTATDTDSASPPPADAFGGEDAEGT